MACACRKSGIDNLTATMIRASRRGYFLPIPRSSYSHGENMSDFGTMRNAGTAPIILDYPETLK
jgi:hypothetical protein